jgi:hypothetical protein
VTVRLLFRCDICGGVPREPTRESLERQLLHHRFGEYVDAGPERWLVWHGRGLYGRTLYACGKHRGELKALVREHYGTIGPHPWSMRTYPSERPPDAASARRRAQATGLPKWGLQ